MNDSRVSSTKIQIHATFKSRVIFRNKREYKE